MNISLLGFKQVERRQHRYKNHDCTQYCCGDDPLLVDDLHGRVVSCVDKQVPNEHIQDEGGNAGPIHCPKDHEQHVEGGHNQEYDGMPPVDSWLIHQSFMLHQ